VLVIPIPESAIAEKKMGIICTLKRRKAGGETHACCGGRAASASGKGK